MMHGDRRYLGRDGFMQEEPTSALFTRLTHTSTKPDVRRILGRRRCGRLSASGWYVSSVCVIVEALKLNDPARPVVLMVYDYGLIFGQDNPLHFVTQRSRRLQRNAVVSLTRGSSGLWLIDAVLCLQLLRPWRSHRTSLGSYDSACSRQPKQDFVRRCAEAKGKGSKRSY